MSENTNEHLEELRTQAEKLGIKVDKRWKEERLQEEIDARGEADLDNAPKGDDIDSVIAGMIPKMAKSTSIDLNRHQIQASIYMRLEKWAEKKGIENWETHLPKHIKQIKDVCDARYEAVQQYREQSRRERERRATL